MATSRQPAKITICYEGKLDNGDVFKAVSEDAPLTVTLGEQQLPPTLENALMGVAEGGTVTVRVPPEEGYGARQKLLVQEIPRKNFSDQLAPKPGMILSLKVEKDGVEHQVPATVMEVSDEKVTVDYNHPLAGHHLTYTVKVLKLE